jgi:hypothetical protein
MLNGTPTVLMEHLLGLLLVRLSYTFLEVPLSCGFPVWFTGSEGLEVRAAQIKSNEEWNDRRNRNANERN